MINASFIHQKRRQTTATDGPLKRRRLVAFEQDACFEHGALEGRQRFFAGSVAVVQMGVFGGIKQVIGAAFESAHLRGIESVRGVSLDQQRTPPVVLGP
jgi:hypothetical protein